MKSIKNKNGDNYDFPMECPLCIDLISKPIVCVGCSYTTCSPCAKKYLLTQSIGAHCMNPECKIKWTVKFLTTLFPKTWINTTYRDHLKKLSLERERSKLPETLAQVPRYKKEAELEAKLKKMGRLLLESKAKTRKIQEAIYELEGQRNKSSKAKLMPHFICPCPTEACKGLVDNKFFCNLCETSVCRRCRVSLNKEEKHECDEEVVETIKLLRGDTKACPNCATLIYKISGCDQMWCTQCRTAFSWKTGQKEEGVIHNPHAIRWQRENGPLLRNNGDIPCGGLAAMYHFSMLPRKEYNLIYPIHRRIAELPSAYGGLLTINTPNRDYEELRKNLVLDRITEDYFKQRIFEKDRLNDRKEENHRILETLQTLAIERFRVLAQKCTHVSRSPRMSLVREQSRDTRYKNLVGEFRREMENIRCFINDAFQEELPPLGTRRPYIIPKNWGPITYRAKVSK